MIYVYDFGYKVSFVIVFQVLVLEMLLGSPLDLQKTLQLL